MPAVWPVQMSVSGGMPILLQWRASETDRSPEVYTWRDDTDEFYFVRPRIDLPPIVVPLIVSNESISLSVLFFFFFWKRSIDPNILFRYSNLN